MKLKQIYTPNSLDIKAVPMTYPNFYTNKKVGGKKNARLEKVVFKSSGKDGKVYGMRTVAQKATS